MNKLSIKAFTAALEARDQRERGVIFAVLVVVIIYGWVVLVKDGMTADQENLERQITNTGSQIQAQINRYQEIQATYDRDPNANARNRLSQVQQETTIVDQRINALYGQLIPPSEMVRVLISMLQRDTNLRLISMENLRPEGLITGANISASVIPGAGGTGDFQVYRHGIRLSLQGEYLETIRYLESLEAMSPSFFWENFSYSTGTYPNGTITLNIYTLSTQREWIGV